MTTAEQQELTPEQKMELLDALLQSHALGRSDQLRAILRHLVNEEIQGKGAGLTEHSVGVAALGRPEDYSPEIDSTVRTRAHELRKRIEEYYREAPAGAWRIELPKGTYQPRFVRIPTPANEETEPAGMEGRTGGGGWWMFCAGFLVALVVVLGIWAYSRPAGAPAAEEAAVADIWGPAAVSGSTVTIALAAPIQLWVREFDPQSLPQNDPPFLLRAPESAPFVEWYRRLKPNHRNSLYLHPNNHSPLWGEAAGAVALAEFFARRSVRVELLSEQSVRPLSLKERHAAVLGRAEYSQLSADLQPAGGYSVRYVPEEMQVAIVDERGKVLHVRERRGRINYGLATVLSRRTGQGNWRTVLFSGINSDGTQAAVEYLTSPRHLMELAKAIRAGGGPAPDAFQVVVRSRSTDSYSLEAERVAIHVLAAR